MFYLCYKTYYVISQNKKIALFYCTAFYTFAIAIKKQLRNNTVYVCLILVYALFTGLKIGHNISYLRSCPYLFLFSVNLVTKSLHDLRLSIFYSLSACQQIFT